jgi:hypothetical protein
MRRPFPIAQGALLALALALALGHTVSLALAQAGGGTLVFRSIDGTLERVDTGLNGVILKGSDGKRHAWQLRAPVIQEAARFKPGDRMWVIYRQLGPSDTAVTALGFPGAAEKPAYVNATGERIVLRIGPFVGNACGPAPPDRIKTQDVPAGSTFVEEGDCWCCATRDKTCELANRSHDANGTGRIILARCFP